MPSTKPIAKPMRDSLTAPDGPDGEGSRMLTAFRVHSPRAAAAIDGVDYRATARLLLALGARSDVYPEMRGYVDLVLAGQRGGGYPDASTNA